jgi:hypothetical protein
MTNLKSVRNELVDIRQAIEATGAGGAEVVEEQKADLRRLARCVELVITRLASEERGKLGRQMTPLERWRATRLRELLCKDDAGRRFVECLERTTA